MVLPICKMEWIFFRTRNRLREEERYLDAPCYNNINVGAPKGAIVAILVFAPLES